MQRKPNLPLDSETSSLLFILLHVSLNNNHYIYDKMKEAYVFHTMFPVPYHGLLHLDCRQLQLHLHPFGKLASR